MIDILMATYNGSKYIQEQLNSILEQTYSNWNLIIRDDGSSDNTIEIIKKYIEKYPLKIKLIEDNYKNIGITMNFSKLVEYSTSNYIMFCDQDDVWKKNKIEKTFSQMKNLENKVNIAMPLLVFSDLTTVDNKLNIINESFWKSQKINPEISKNLYQVLAQNVVTGCTIMINKKSKEQFFPISTKNILHDHWLVVNICKYGKIAYINESLIYYRQHSTNKLGELKIGFKYFFYQIIKIFKNLNLYKDKYNNFSFKVNFFKIIYYKIYLNLKRL